MTYGRLPTLVPSELRFLPTFCLSISWYCFYLFIDLRFLSSPIGRRCLPFTNFSLFFGYLPLLVTLFLGASSNYSIGHIKAFVNNFWLDLRIISKEHILLLLSFLQYFGLQS